MHCTGFDENTEIRVTALFSGVRSGNRTVHRIARLKTEFMEKVATMVSEQELIERIRCGDLVSFKTLFERYYCGVHAFTRGVADDEFHADEITQNVFIRLWLKRTALDPERNFKAFLYTLAKHEIADYFRSDRYGRRKLRLDMLHDAVHVQEQFAAAYDADRMQQLVLDEVERMPAQRREVFRLSRIEGLTNDEIAQRLRISKRTVEGHLNAALRTLRAKVGKFVFWLTFFILVQ